MKEQDGDLRYRLVKLYDRVNGSALAEKYSSPMSEDENRVAARLMTEREERN